MTINVGDSIPTANLTKMDAEGPQPVVTDQYFANRKVVLFAVPGAFTPTCSAKHLPGFVDHAGDILAKGVDEIACMSVNDVFVMDAWGESANAADITMLADGNGEFTRALGLEMDASAFGMGQRSQRFAVVVDDGKVVHLAVEKPGEFNVSSAQSVLSAL